ncbi:hypothetical protein ACQKFM_31295 [Paenibacillus xylanexedens]|uniref:hypothetical protein n=1 Tax=Paenibacillus xylanexedens TaxID=528191 RepID=UPI003D00AAB3
MNFSDFYFQLFDDIDTLIVQTTKLRDSLPDEKEMERVSLNGELMGLRRARTAAKNLFNATVEKI